MNKYDFVKLNKKAVKRFYGTNDHAEMYCKSNNLETMTNQEFVQYVADHIAFYSGETLGLIDGNGADKNVWRVIWFSTLLGEWREHFFDEEDLDIYEIVKAL